MEPLVTVIVPVYKVEQYLDRCFESLTNQVYKNLQIVFVDDGSPDRCGTMCDEYAKADNRVEVVHKQNGGLGFARNSGMGIARGKYIVFVDSDDFISERFVSEMLSAIERNGADTSICGIIKYYNEEKQVSRRICSETILYQNEDVKEKVLLGMIGTNPSATRETEIPMSVWHCMYSKEIIDAYGIRFHSEREFISEDIIFQIDYLQHSQKTVLIPEELYFYFSAQEGSLSTKYRKNRFEEEKKLEIELDRKLGFFLEKGKYRNRLSRLFLGRVRTCLAMEYFMGTKEGFTRIVNDSLLKEILQDYPYRKNPVKLHIFNWALKYRLEWLLKALIRLRG